MPPENEIMDARITAEALDPLTPVSWTFKQLQIHGLKGGTPMPAAVRKWFSDNTTGTGGPPPPPEVIGWLTKSLQSPGWKG